MPINPMVMPPAQNAPNVLIVEDQETIQEMLLMVFAKAGCATRLAATVREAIQHLEYPTDAIVLDLNLPDGTGVDVLRHIRARHLPIRVAITTGAMEPTLRARVAALDPDKLFPKPYSASELVAWVRAIAQ